MLMLAALIHHEATHAAGRSPMLLRDINEARRALANGAVGALPALSLRSTVCTSALVALMRTF